jgi:hypothetical protein
LPFGSVTLQPGLDVEKTPLLLRAGFTASQLIRFRDSLAQKFGGWTKFFPFAVSGIPRDLHAWQDLDNIKYLSVATTSQLAVIFNNSLSDISPQVLTSNFAPTNITSTLNSTTINITDPNIANVTVEDSVLFNTPVSIGGIVLSGLFQITQITGADSYQIQAPVAVTTTAPAVVIEFTTTLNSPTILVTFTNHQQIVGNMINFVIPTVANGVAIFGSYNILTVPGANTFTIAAATQATASGSFFMNNDEVQLIYQIALGPAPAGSGFGLGGFGLGGFGTGVSTGQQTGTDLAAASWTTDNWGEILIACPVNGAIYMWEPGTGFQTASIIATAPPYNGGIFISTTQQILIAWGSSVAVGIGIQQQPLLVQWSDVSNFFQWQATAATQAGNFTIPLGSKLVAGLAVANQNLLWTDEDLWAMNYIGPPDVFGFTTVGYGMGAVSAHSVQNLRGSVFWMGTSNFYYYSGGTANVLPCPVWDAVFQNLNVAFANNICSMANTPFNEIGWFYPSLASTTGENDSYVKMNILEPSAPWDIGLITQMQRSAWIDQSLLGMPIASTSSGIIYMQETTPDADGVPINSSFTTGFFYLAEGEQFVIVDQVMPDFKWETFTGTTSAQIQLTFNVTDFPGNVPEVFGPFTVTQATDYLEVWFRGRLMSITVSSNDLGSFYRLGSIKYRYAPSGRR